VDGVRTGHGDRLWLLGALVVGWALRVWQLGAVPFGFHPDEGHYATDAWRVWQGWRPIFMPGNNGREPLFMYLMAPLLGLVGPTIWTARLTSAFVGVLAIAAAFTFARALPLPRPGRTALFAAALLAVSFWPVAQARYALRAHLLPVWVALLLWAWWRAVAPAPETTWLRSARWGTLAGVFLAAALYTHLTGRLLPAILVLSALFTAARLRTWRPLGQLALALAVAGVLALPLALYFQGNPEMVGYRSDQVSALNPEVNDGDLPGYLVENAWNLVAMPNLSGDRSWYHNIPGRPVFGLLAGLAFLAGLLLALRDLVGRRGPLPQCAAVLVLTALAVTLVPSWLSAGAPNYVRLTGTWPMLFLLPAWALAEGAGWLDDWGRRAGAGRDRFLWTHLGSLVAAGLLVATGLATARDYFTLYAPRPEVYDAFNGAAVARGYAVQRLAAEGPLYVSPAIWQQSVIRFVNTAAPPGSFDPRSGLVLPPTGDARYAFDPVEADDATAFQQRWPNFTAQTVPDARGTPALLLYHLRRAAWPALPTTVTRSFGDHMTLVGVKLPAQPFRPGDRVDLAFEWLAGQPTATDHQLFVHLDDAAGRTVAQYDGPPLDGSYGTDKWQAGERILQPVSLALPTDAPAGPLTVRLGWYDYRNQQRLPVAGDDDGAVEVGTISVAK
jgi:4-amino-4-deoxy-L-arabinose transferase-like glycosyltransferase